MIIVGSCIIEQPKKIKGDNDTFRTVILTVTGWRVFVEFVERALIHDLGDELGPENQSQITAAIIRSGVLAEENIWYR